MRFDRNRTPRETPPTVAASETSGYQRPRNLLPYPYLSHTERDRRWKLARSAMAREAVDCVIVPNGDWQRSAVQARARYLTLVGDAESDVAVVFPIEGEPTVIVRRPDEWATTQPWCTDLREAKPGFADAVCERLRECRLPLRRVGIVGMPRPSHDGAIGADLMRELMSGFPGVEWLDFASRIDDIRVLKSSEEIAFLRHSAWIVDQAYRSAIGALRPNVSDRMVWGTALETLCRLGSELPVRVRWRAGRRPSLLCEPSLQRIERPWICLSEIEAGWGGYRTRGKQPFACGDPDALYEELARFQALVWNESSELIRPGVEIGDLRRGVEATARRLAPRRGPAAGATCQLRIRGCGLGWDAPIVGGRQATDHDLAMRAEPAWCFLFEPCAVLGPHRFAWADSIVVTERGCERLGRAPQIIQIAA